MSASTAPGCKAAMKQIAAASLTGVTVRWGQPTQEADVQFEMLYLGAVDFQSEWKYIGRGTRQENYSVTVTLQAIKAGDDEQGTEERGWQLWSLFTEALRTDSFDASASLLRAAGVKQFDDITGRMVTQPMPESWAATLTAQINVWAHV